VYRTIGRNPFAMYEAQENRGVTLSLMLSESNHLMIISVPPVVTPKIPCAKKNGKLSTIKYDTC
jgi:hypothetical protein